MSEPIAIPVQESPKPDKVGNLIKSVRAEIKDYITPNKNLSSSSKGRLLIFWISTTFLIWTFSGSKIFPGPKEIWTAWSTLLHQGFLHDLMTSTAFCLKAMAYASIISLFIAYLSVIPLVRTPIEFIAKARFLSTAGLSFLFMELTSDMEGQKMAILVFAISVFLITGACGVIAGMKTEEYDYPRTLKFNEWEIVGESIIRGKLADMLEIIRQNFAIAWMMLAMVETYCQSDGGIGVVLTLKNKHFELDSVYAIQINILIVGVFFDWLIGWLTRKICPASAITKNRK
jgi:NitT/TauT family transport system permease protein